MKPPISTANTFFIANDSFETCVVAGNLTRPKIALLAWRLLYVFAFAIVVHNHRCPAAWRTSHSKTGGGDSCTGRLSNDPGRYQRCFKRRHDTGCAWNLRGEPQFSWKSYSSDKRRRR